MYNKHYYYYDNIVDTEIEYAKELSDVFSTDDSRVEMFRIDAQKKNTQRSTVSQIITTSLIAVTLFLSFVYTPKFIIAGFVIGFLYSLIDVTIREKCKMIEKMTRPIKDYSDLALFVKSVEKSDAVRKYASEVSKRRELYVYDYWISKDLELKEYAENKEQVVKLVKETNMRKLNEVLK